MKTDKFAGFLKKNPRKFSRFKAFKPRIGTFEKNETGGRSLKASH
jgi:hypothetical protein